MNKRKAIVIILIIFSLSIIAALIVGLYRNQQINEAENLVKDARISIAKCDFDEAIGLLQQSKGKWELKDIDSKISNTKAIKVSYTNFIKAEEEFKNKKWSKSIELYKKVIKEDLCSSDEDVKIAKAEKELSSVKKQETKKSNNPARKNLLGATTQSLPPVEKKKTNQAVEKTKKQAVANKSDENKAEEQVNDLKDTLYQSAVAAFDDCINNIYSGLGYFGSYNDDLALDSFDAATDKCKETKVLIQQLGFSSPEVTIYNNLISSLDNYIAAAQSYYNMMYFLIYDGYWDDQSYTDGETFLDAANYYISLI